MALRSRKFDGKAFVGTGALCAAAILLLSGCSAKTPQGPLLARMERENRETVRSRDSSWDIVPRVDVATGQAAVFGQSEGGHSKPHLNLAETTWEPHSGYAKNRLLAPERGADSDYIDKADVYWKLNWIRKQVLSGEVPEDLDKRLAKVREQLETTVQDNNYRLAEEAITRYENGFEHLRADQVLQRAGVPTTIVPWRSGEAAVRKFIDNNGLGFGGQKRKTTTQLGDSEDEDRPSLLRRSRRYRSRLSADQEEVIDLILRYTREYHAAPGELMKREWEEAIRVTNKLRDELGLMNRTPNQDGDFAVVSEAARTRSETVMDQMGSMGDHHSTFWRPDRTV
jgi:hypothetical protein